MSTASSVITPVNTWAPVCKFLVALYSHLTHLQEFFKDTNTGKIHIIVSLSTGSYGPFLPYVYTATDSTLRNWSGPVVMSGISNAGLGYIDTFPVLLG